MKNPHAVALGRKGGLARKGKPGRKLSSEEARRIRAMRGKATPKDETAHLLKSPANAKRLLEAIEESKKNPRP